MHALYSRRQRDNLLQLKVVTLLHDFFFNIIKHQPSYVSNIIFTPIISHISSTGLLVNEVQENRSIYFTIYTQKTVIEKWLNGPDNTGCSDYYW